MDNNVAWKHVKAADMAPFRNQKQDASIPLTEAETILKKMLNCKEKASAGDEFDALDSEEIADNNNEPDQEDEASKEDSGVTPAVHGNSICLENSGKVIGDTAPCLARQCPKKGWQKLVRRNLSKKRHCKTAKAASNAFKMKQCDVIPLSRTFLTGKQQALGH
jgi:hypothetical protein